MRIKKHAFVATLTNADGSTTHLVAPFVSSDDAMRYFKHTAHITEAKLESVVSADQFFDGDTWELRAPRFLD